MPAVEEIVEPEAVVSPGDAWPAEVAPPGAAGSEPEPAVVELLAASPADEARRQAQLAEEATDPSRRAAAWLASASAARQAGAPLDEVRRAIELAREAEPDAPAPGRRWPSWRRHWGDPMAAARAHLAVSIRTEGPAAADAALVAARLFLEQERPPTPSARCAPPPWESGATCRRS